jgi:hypothetical protein
VIAAASSYHGLLEGFLAALGATMQGEAHLHRIWYDLRSQALFEPAFRADVAEIDLSLETMIWRVMTRLSRLSEKSVDMPPALAYAIFDGLFQQCLLKHLSGQAGAIAEMQENGRLILERIFET